MLTISPTYSTEASNLVPETEFYYKQKLAKFVAASSSEVVGRFTNTNELFSISFNEIVTVLSPLPCRLRAIKSGTAFKLNIGKYRDTRYIKVGSCSCLRIKDREVDCCEISPETLVVPIGVIAYVQSDTSSVSEPLPSDPPGA
jgi:hypothetical protein